MMMVPMTREEESAIYWAEYYAAKKKANADRRRAYAQRAERDALAAEREARRACRGK